MSSKINDEQHWRKLMIAAQRGDESAYHELLTDLNVVIKQFLIKQFGNDISHDDCVQECLLAIHQARHTYLPEKPIRPWIFAIVRYRTIDLLRKKTPNTVNNHLDTMSTDTQTSTEYSIDSTTLLGSLSDALREPLYLTKFLGLTYKECALRLGITESTAKVRVFRAIRQLQQAWGES